MAPDNGSDRLRESASTLVRDVSRVALLAVLDYLIVRRRD